ncbi:SEC-C metal-binding domain-containing protein [Acinetobacter wanghuae]|uniref:SEC-C metal-binding domain-containing protein n=1 Tax=Acinetobacter wanghuae TaxID=2662362 RepID=UPI003AF59D88
MVEGETLDSESFIRSYDRTRLSKTELATLIALTFKNYNGNIPLSKELISEKALNIYQLFEELHQTFFPTELSEEQLLSDAFFSSGHMMREAIFYSAEGAFKHQYRDISKIRYEPDNVWLKQNNGFSIEELVTVVSTIEKIQLEKANNLLANNIGKEIKTFLPIFQFNLTELLKESQLPLNTIESCINTLLCHPKDEGFGIFQSVDDFNCTNAYPIIKIENDYYTFGTQTLWESVYESPFFWFKDTPYNNQASKNRGLFTEHFTASRLAKVFGEEKVFTNIDLFRGNNKACEIDVLVVFGKMALIIQAKSKKLTISARKGNSLQIEKDFQAAVEEAYEQALDCSELIQSKDIIFKDETGEIIELPREYNTILPICVVSDHYPALASQARQFLKPKVNDVLHHPFVTDVFFIDTLTEMLPSPLHIFDYLLKRSNYGNSIVINHELSTLAVYINKNLYFQDEFQLMMLDDDVTCDLELAMMARRDNLKDIPLTPDGLLTRFKNTHVGNLIDQVSFSIEEKLQQIGLHLLSLDEKTLNFINEALEKMLRQFSIDKKNHDLTIPIYQSQTGITIHCNADCYETAYSRLKKHIERRKYSEKAKSWIGLCINPSSLKISMALHESYEWSFSPSLQAIVDEFNLRSTKNVLRIGEPISFKANTSLPIIKNQSKIGRNEPCPCGSGIKFKKCCLI